MILGGKGWNREVGNHQIVNSLVHRSEEVLASKWLFIALSNGDKVQGSDLMECIDKKETRSPQERE